MALSHKTTNKQTEAIGINSCTHIHTQHTKDFRTGTRKGGDRYITINENIIAIDVGREIHVTMSPIWWPRSK